MGSQKNQKKKRGGKPQQPASSKAPSSTVHSSDTSGNPVASESVDSNPDPQVKESGNADMPSTNVEKQDEGQPSKQGEVHLYPVNVKTQTGEKLQLQLSPGDSVMDVRQLLLEVKETCFYTCYDLLLHTNDGSAHRLEDHNEISDVADISTCDCQLEMVAAYYDDRSIRAHLLRTRELLSLSTMHSSASKSLELQNETGRDTSANIGLDPSKIEVTELDKLRDLKETSSLLPDLFVPPRQEIQLVQSMEFSSFNPPPSYRRLSGDLIYLDVVTLEGKKYCITGTTKAFYVNSSTGILLEPKPMKSFSDSPTLVGLLQKLSSTFKQAFQDILARRASAHPFENVQSLLPPNSWLGVHPVPGHKRDAARAENVVTLTFGSELIGMQRDWNEELQSCREFPHSLSHQRILRDRALYKVTTDFVDAAVNGAVGVINRCIPPINPTDPECFHMYVHNNIFFSFAFDADTDKSLRGHESDSVSDTKIADVPQNSGEKDGATERQLADNEQATYASANNDLKGTKAYQEADIDGLYNLAMVIVDYRGHRVIAQSVLPGILQGDKSESLLYGSVDNGKKISWNEDFHSKVAEAAKRLHLKEHTVLDASGNAFRLAAPVECKGIVGSDDRHYLLDLMRVTPRDANYTEPGSRYCILRPELITAFCRAKAAEKLKAQSKSDIDSEAVVTSEDGAAQSDSEGQITSDTGAVVEVCDSGSESKHATEDILFNPNVFAEVRLAGSPEEIAADEEDVRKASCYLKDVVLPKFISDLCTLEVSPMDGQTLTEALHANGINVRYIGKVAVDTGDFPHLRELCTNEIIVRSAKHILKDVLRETEDHDLGNAITHFFNCLFGNVASPGNSKSQKKTLQDGTSRVDSWKFAKNQGKTKKRASSVKNQSLYSSISSDGLWSDIQEFAKLKYQFQLHDNARLDAKKIPVIRNLCQKVGISIAARTYDLSEAAPFLGPDILDLQPVVKHAIPFSSAARDLVERGKVHLAEGMLSEAYGTFSEAFTILQQVTGPMHREVANCCRYLAMVLYHAGDMGGAINQQQKELIINERCLGLDHPDTAHSYGNMALFYHGLNNTELALRHMARALLLLCLSSGPNHPDIAATFINVAMMYQDIGNLSKALQFLNEAKNKNEKLLGKEHIQTAVCHHALAILYNCMPNYTLSVQNEKKTYDILVKKLGEDDPRSRDSLNWINTFNKRMAQAQQSSTEAHSILQAHPELIQALQAAAGAGSVANSNGSVNKSLNASILGEPLPRGRGVDERAARAAAEARKKAAARGLAVRPQGGPAQALPPLTRLINIINSGMTTETVNGEGNNSNNGAENGHASGVNGSASVKESKKGQQQQTPIGLGAGLQQKTKPKGK